MARSSRIEIEKFNGKTFEQWKLKMEDLLIDREQWVVVKPIIVMVCMSKEYLDKIDRKPRSTI